MKIKIFIVTYNNDIILNNNLKHIYESDIVKYSYHIYVINNFSKLDTLKFPNLTVLDNVCRPDFSKGYLSRNWNQALYNGFKDLNKPDCDLLIAMQNDTYVLPNCFSNTIQASKFVDFFTVGAGDQYMVWTSSAVKRLGIFDERFCSLGCQEGDYFLNAMMIDNYFNHRKVSINDYHHNRLYNIIEGIEDKFIKPEAHLNQSVVNKKWNPHCLRVFEKKWGIPDTHWTPEIKKSLIRPHLERYFLYPDFESGINQNSLHFQNYFL